VVYLPCNHRGDG